MAVLHKNENIEVDVDTGVISENTLVAFKNGWVNASNDLPENSAKGWCLKVSNGKCWVLLKGKVTITGHGFTKGKTLYLDNSGNFSKIEDLTLENITLQRVGFVLDSNTIYFKPEFNLYLL